VDSVTIVTRSPNLNGGTERVVFLLCAALRRGGVDADVLLLVKDTDRHVADVTQKFYLANGAPTSVVTSDTHRSALVRNITALRPVFRTLPSKALNIHYTTPGSASLSEVIAARLARKVCVLTLHHPEPFVNTSWRRRVAVALALRLASSVVVDTEYSRELLLSDLLCRVAVKVIPLGVPIPAPPTESRGRSRLTLGVPEDAFVVGHLGRLVDYKGLMLVIQAVASMDPFTVLLVAGEGPDGSEMKRQATLLLGERAIFLGAITDKDRFYRSLDVFAMPSSLEGFGLVYVEAALHGVPSVASRTGGVPFVVADGQTGVLVNRAITDVVTALAKLRADPALVRAMGDQARRCALENFTDAAMAENYRHLVSQIRQVSLMR